MEKGCADQRVTERLPRAGHGCSEARGGESFQFRRWSFVVGRSKSSCAPLGLTRSDHVPHSWRRGLYSFAAPRLEHLQHLGQRRTTNDQRRGLLPACTANLTSSHQWVKLSARGVGRLSQSLPGDKSPWADCSTARR